jgi:hypothetical protein
MTYRLSVEGDTDSTVSAPVVKIPPPAVVEVIDTVNNNNNNENKEEEMPYKIHSRNFPVTKTKLDRTNFVLELLESKKVENFSLLTGIMGTFKILSKMNI